LKSSEQLQYEGFLKTPQLWEGSLLGLQQINLPQINTLQLTTSILQKRLGHRVEQFVFHELENNTNCQITATNLQIIENKITLGELDCMLQYHNISIHLEIVYKFYLYDQTVGNTAIEHWIGPNRKDSLIDKLTKLKNKQLPLLQHPTTQLTLKNININIEKMKQQVYFKAQLFVPIHLLQHSFLTINKECISGFYISFSKLSTLKNNFFYIPTKLEWLIKPHQNTQWISFEKFRLQILPFIKNNQSPMCWIKSKKGEL